MSTLAGYTFQIGWHCWHPKLLHFSSHPNLGRFAIHHCLLFHSALLKDSIYYLIKPWSSGMSKRVVLTNYDLKHRPAKCLQENFSEILFHYKLWPLYPDLNVACNFFKFNFIICYYIWKIKLKNAFMKTHRNLWSKYCIDFGKDHCGQFQKSSNAGILLLL